ncbi:MAG: LysR substrate-binding domain-containing protein [Solirubrobacteraceae bacterium]
MSPRALRRLRERGRGRHALPARGHDRVPLHELRAGRLDLVVAFCAPPDDALQRERLRDEPAVVHVEVSHPLATRSSVALTDLRDETLIVAGSPDSPGFTSTIAGLCRDSGVEPKTISDPYPDLGLQAIREGLGVVVYVRTAFAQNLDGSVFVPIDPPAAVRPALEARHP